MYGIIYKVTSLDKRVYIGQTTKTLKLRKRQHICMAKNEWHPTLFLNTLIKEGINNFEWEQIDTANNQDELDQKEKYYINYYKSNDINFGFNLTEGGLYAKHNEETKRKISEAQKGDKHHMFGKHHNKETKKKISKGNKGKIISQETRQRMSNAQKGHIVSNDTRKKISNATKKYFESSEHRKLISESNKRRIISEDTKKKISRANKGKKKTEEECQNIRERLLGGKLSLETRKKISESHKGKKLSIEHKKKITESLKKCWIKRKEEFK